MSVLYESWNECGGDWKQSQLYMSAVHKNKHKLKGVRVWMVFDELVKRFGPVGAQAIVSRKENDKELKVKEIRPHPECPEEKDCPDKPAASSHYGAISIN